MLYQAGTQRIEVIVKKETSGGTDGAKQIDAENISANGGDSETSPNGAGLSKKQKRILKTNLTHGLAVARQVTGLGIEYYISGIANRTGDQALQDTVRRKMEIVEDVSGFAMSVGMGITYGSWGGPVGMIFGGLFAGISTAVSTAVKYGERRREYNYKVFKENNSIEYKRARASINLTTGRLR